MGTNYNPNVTTIQIYREDAEFISKHRKPGEITRDTITRILRAYRAVQRP